MRSRQSSHARTRSRPRVWLAALTTLTALAVSAPASTAERQSSPARPWATAGIVREWNAIAGQAALDACLAPANNPLHESRMYVAVHIAVHDGLNAIDRRFEPYAFAAPLGAWRVLRRHRGDRCP